jgi:hypothetical protein
MLVVHLVHMVIHMVQVILFLLLYLCMVYLLDIFNPNNNNILI